MIIAFDDKLDMCLRIINKSNDIGAIVTIYTEITEKILTAQNIESSRVVSYDRLNECVNNVYFEYIIVYGHESYVIGALLAIGVVKEKILDLRVVGSPNILATSVLLQKYYAEAEAYKMFVTGMSYAYYGIDLGSFDCRAINFALDSQDLYYDYQIVKRVLQNPKQSFKYGLITLSPCSFHYDLSVSTESYRVLGYELALQKTNHFVLNDLLMRKLFTPGFLGMSVDPAGWDINDIMSAKKLMDHPMNVESILSARKRAAGWDKKRFPLTVEENKKILASYIKLCQEKGIEPILIIFPYTDIFQKWFSKQILDEFYYIIKQVQAETGIRLFNYFSSPEFDYNDFRDCDHLNIQGSIKMTKILNKALLSV